jgi:hypothetical protein
MNEITNDIFHRIHGGTAAGQDNNKNFNACVGERIGGRMAPGALTGLDAGYATGLLTGNPIGVGILSLSGAAAGAVSGAAMAIGECALKSGAKSASDTVMCTHFHQKGMLPHQLWRISSLHANRKMHPATFRGYQVYGIPYVKLMRRSRLAEKLAFPLLLWRTEEVAYQMGLRKKGNWKGKLVRALTEPVWFITGLMVKEQNWESLWRENSAAV